MPKKQYVFGDSKYITLLYNPKIQVKKNSKSKRKSLSIKAKQLSKKGNFIYVYAHWCKVCKKYEDMWNTLALQYKNRLNFLSFDGSLEDNIKSRIQMGILYYPTFIYVNKKSELEEYKGELKEKNIREFLDDRI